MKWAPLALMLCCTVGNPPDCITKCGLEIYKPKWKCSDYQLAEDMSMAALVRTADARLTDCKGLSAWRVEVQSTINFDTLAKGTVHGITHCNLNYIEIGSDYPPQSSLTHEIVHVLQECVPLPPTDEQDPDHSNWGRDGIYEAIRSVEYSDHSK